MDAASPTAFHALPAAAPPPCIGATPSPLQLVAEGDLQRELEDIVARGGLGDFLAQTGDAIDLASQAPLFAEELDPLLGRIREALGQLPTEALSAVEREALDATLARLDDHLGPAQSPLPGSEVPGGGLQAHEDAGGHLIERHVGKTEQSLLERVRNENISAASSFRDLPEAEHFVAQTLDEHQDRIEAWRDGAGGNRLVVDARFDASTGISVARGASEAVDVFSVRLVLERSDRLDIGYRIVTGYPSAP
ncbi:hypothetical protein QFW77_17400 [Luteimonas sp. RD2P54]|uniref:Bacterial CdiA-CT RNAse A domain-containing protein n=1 Tax=Luteimonas endophytica TaxID=3042023 RepID=A0ABT6JDD6_9GAMM|nr:RNase A-like domain-containing protein [Luteimonas endophytica]MDH5824749.1 hypothetical protein [Luteimonas endophytica]